MGCTFISSALQLQSHALCLSAGTVRMLICMADACARYPAFRASHRRLPPFAPRLAAQLGDSCSTVAPGSNLQCCKTKVAEGTADSWCSDTYPEVSSGIAPCQVCYWPPPLPASPHQRLLLTHTGKPLHHTLQLYPDGSSCGTVTPGTEKECCEAKIADGQRDAWCEQNYSEVRVYSCPAHQPSPAQQTACYRPSDTSVHLIMQH